jgi:hypothetical protein
MLFLSFLRFASFRVVSLSSTSVVATLDWPLKIFATLDGFECPTNKPQSKEKFGKKIWFQREMKKLSLFLFSYCKNAAKAVISEESLNFSSLKRYTGHAYRLILHHQNFYSFL